ncbi:WXG100 family type VII secretion target [Micromonospora sp. NBC_00821]|uniref:WXG100 family type VII secretion target n=1 Tax=Micromonospora sp. NBC_00821 TaxID=2975977 RepID=UPI002ED419EF|nr:WXG100 family type VII secretion target [Micromonospora sp. NBC_00821]
MTSNPLVAAAADTPPSAWAGVWICEDIELIAQGVRTGSWIDGSLGVVSASLDALAFVSDPVGALLQYGIAWLIEHVKPLSEALDWLAGDPAQITAHAQTWRNVAGSLRDDAAELARAVRADVAGWGGSAGPAYRAWAAEQQQAITGLAQGADTMAAITEGAAGLVAAVRLLVRDAIATCVSRIIVYAGELLITGGLAAPLVVEQVTTLVASWGARIARLLRGLLASLRRLIPEMRRLGDLIDKLKQALGRLQKQPPAPQKPDGSEPTKIPGDPGRPDFTRAEIDARKITAYAMNPDHPVGKNKYRVINSTTGLGPDDTDGIMQQIREGVVTGNPVLGKADEFGKRWNVDLPLTGPGGTLIVRTAWILENGSSSPRMVTISFPPKEG